MKDTIFNTGDKLDIFDKIHTKMSSLDADRKMLDEKAMFAIKNLELRMKAVDDHAEENQKIFDNMRIHTHQV